MTIPFQLQEALRDSITSGTFVDTKFWVFSKRGSKSGRVGEPRALFVNGHVAKRVPRLASLLDGREAKENLRAGFPTDRRPYTDDYDYESDSDLEDGNDGDHDDDVPDDEPASVPQVVTDKPRKSSVVILGKSEAKGNESSDMVSVSDIESLFTESSETKDEKEPTSSGHVGKVIVIEDVAFITFQAFLRYLYTDEIEFAPWGSAERRTARAVEKISESYGIPKPSPKSVYRLADKVYDIPELKQLALRQIRQDLSKCNITEEVFSRYTARYPELRELELRQLARVLLSSDSGPTLELLKMRIKSYVHGELPHAEDILPALYEFMENDESVKETPLPAASSPNQQSTGEDWEGLKKALTSSLTSGTFLDSQFYAVESRSLNGSPKVRPVYFCSTIGGSFTCKLAAYSSTLRAQRAPPRCADGYDSDIDDESPDLEGSAERYPCSELVREIRTAANSPMEPALLLKSGAAKTWSAIFLYVYTGQITFATLGSQNVAPSEKQAEDGSSQDEMEPPRESGGLSDTTPGAVAVEPCSPKSVYCLANKVGLTGLCDISFKDIESKLDKSNIMHEFFSPFAANHKNIREMEHDLFQSKLKASVDGALISDMIRSSSSGLNSHRTTAMELIIERCIQDRRERMARKAKDSLRPDPTPQPKSEAPDTPTPQVQSPISATASRQPSKSLSSEITAIAGSLGSTSDDHEASQGSLALSESTKRVEKAARREESPTVVKTNPFPSEDFVELTCSECNVKQPRSSLTDGVWCSLCLSTRQAWYWMKCTGCGTGRWYNTINACITCHKKFK